MRARVKAIDAAKVLCREFGVDMASDGATKILDILESERKQQDRDTRHACAEAINRCADQNCSGNAISRGEAHNKCMNVRAV